jgi:integrase
MRWGLSPATIIISAGYGDLELRTYDLRHSFATALYAADGDLGATQELMIHADARTTKRYALGSVNPRALLAMARFEAATSTTPPTGRGGTRSGGREKSSRNLP